VAEIVEDGDDPRVPARHPSGRERPVIHEAKKWEYQKINKIRMPKRLDAEIRNCGAAGQGKARGQGMRRGARTSGRALSSSKNLITPRVGTPWSMLQVMEPIGKVFDVNDGTLGQSGSPLDHILQLAHVAGPRIAMQEGNGFQRHNALMGRDLPFAAQK